MLHLCLRPQPLSVLSTNRFPALFSEDLALEDMYAIRPPVVAAVEFSVLAFAPELKSAAAKTNAALATPVMVATQVTSLSISSC